MLYNLTELKGLTMKARDGEIGEVEDFYFDDDKWTIRYLVVDTGTWLPGRRVLISPISVGRADQVNRRVEVDLTRKQIEDSPGVETDKPVSRQYELSYFNYYGYPYYWGGPYAWGPAATPAVMPVPLGTATRSPTSIEEMQRREQESSDPHLHSADEVIGRYYIEANDGDIGHVEEFLIDDESWAIRYMVVDTRNWWPGKKVLVAPQWIERVSWNDSRVYVNLSRANIQGAPEYDRNAPLSRDYESNLHRHYGRSPYWG
ncbi:MAG TPA: PRC-barrel domain-containing protein [Candidatus Binatia bacterium]|nr:PRC-barrel domain-containing protein [Candidatus Binatia bacterium]